MQNFIFQNATKIYFGKGCVKEYLACLLRGSQRVLLAYGGGSIKANGVYGQVMGILSAAGKTVVEFAGIRPNPTCVKVQQGAALAREEKVDIILGIGGGSVIDCCKAVAMAAVYPGDIWDDFWARPGVVDFEPLPLGAIVTAAGAGSEMNGGAVITNEEKKIKTGRDYPACNPRFALMDPTYTLSLPKEQMVSGGFDILSHIMEAYFSWPDEDNVSDDIAEALMQGVIRDLRASVKDPQDYTARSNLMWESAMAENRILKLASGVASRATRSSTSWGPTPAATTARGWQCCIRLITAASAGRRNKNSPALPPVSGAFRQGGRARKSWPKPGWKHWQVLFRSLACPLPCGSWAWPMRKCCPSLRVPAIWRRPAAPK